MRPAWRGIAGWALIVAAFVLAALFVPWPINGTAAAVLVMGITGAWLVGEQVQKDGGQR